MVDTCRSVLRRARRASTTTYLDLDLRDVNWSTHQAYADVVRDALGDVDVIVGTELEFGALLGVDAVDVVGAVEARLSPTPDRVVIVKHGDRGATVFAGDESVHAPAFAVTEGSSVGAGDSFAAGLIAARGRGDDWRQATRLASACAAITVSRFGCSTGFPHRREVSDFLEAQQRLVATERA
jgi:5-dehydro-2-deoxygluconokinase